MSMNDTSQDLICRINPIGEVGSNINYKYYWLKNGEGYILDRGVSDIIYEGFNSWINNFIVDESGDIYLLVITDVFSSPEDYDYDIAVHKYDSSLNLMWNDTISIPGEQGGAELISDNDNLFVFLKNGTSPFSLFLSKYNFGDSVLSSEGKTIFTEDYTEIIYNVQKVLMAEDGSFYSVGCGNYLGTQDDFYLSKINSDLTYGWTYIFGNISNVNECGYDIEFSSDGNLYALSRFQNYQDYEDNYAILKITPEGELIWNNTIFLSDYGVNYIIENIEVDSDDNIYLIGEDDFSNIVLLKLDSMGNVVLYKVIEQVAEGSYEEYYSGIFELENDQFLRLMFSKYDGISTEDMYISRYDKMGNNLERKMVEWNNNYYWDDAEFFGGNMLYSGSDGSNVFLGIISEYFISENGEDLEYSIIPSSETSSGDVWTCEGFAYDVNTGESSEIVSSEVIIRDDYFSLDLLSDENVLVNGSISPVNVKVTCNLGDCDLNLSLFGYNNSLSGVIEKKLPVMIYTNFDEVYEGVDYITYPSCVDLGRCDCLSEGFCLAYFGGDGLWAFNPKYENTQQVLEFLMNSIEDYSPTNSEWAWGKCSEVTEFYNYFTYLGLQSTISSYSISAPAPEKEPGETDSESMFSCLHVLDSDDYVDLEFFNMSLINETLGYAGGVYYHYYRNFSFLEKYFLIGNNNLELIYSNSSAISLNLKNGESKIVTFYVGSNFEDLEEDVVLRVSGVSDLSSSSLEFYSDIVEKVEEEIEEEEVVSSGGYFVSSGGEAVEIINESGEIIQNISSDDVEISIYGRIVEKEDEFIDLSKAKDYGVSSSGIKLIENYVNMTYIDKEKYLGEKIDVDYRIKDILDLKYEGSISFYVDNEFFGDVNLPVPKDLRVGDYFIETEVRTPDNFRITGYHSLIVEEGESEFPIIPILIMAILVVSIIIVLHQISKKNK
ncbi:hypothetical protein JXM83_00120, partial [Candidatus Woesearchaeota archaeon]|nr:hypothetical protein [Candidatus Woesearchaeota archaeon]